MYTVLRGITHGTPLWSQTTPKAMAEFAAGKFNSIALTDVSQLYMCVQYFEAMKERGVKPLIGIQIKIDDDAEEHGFVTVIAKNGQGWEDLLKLVYLTNQKYRGTPRLNVFEFIQNISSNLIVITNCFLDIFENLLPTAYYGVNLIEDQRLPTKLKPVAITPNLFLTKQDSLLNKYLLCNATKTDMKTASHKSFTDGRFYIPSEEELIEWGYHPDEIANTNEVYEQVLDFDILRKQELPRFDCPDQLTEAQYLRELCRQGYKRLKINDPVYVERIKHELSVIEGAGMSGYFLIMYDIMRWCREQNILVGMGRGSAAGCLISYLVGITSVDPIKYKLMFERFYTPERKGDLIDIDTDLPPSKREDVIQYIQNKYGAARFAQLCTFTTLKGPAAIKAVLRAEGVDAGEQNYITKTMPPEGKIAPYLEKQSKELGTPSMVLWCINHVEEFEQWCSPNFDGVYAAEFQAAIKLDQTIIGRGRHASAYALSNTEIYKRAPLIWDESAERYVVGVDMDDAEKLGVIKLDLLGLALLDKADYTRRVLKNGSF